MQEPRAIDVRVVRQQAPGRIGYLKDLSGKQAGETVTVRLAPCGKATARYVDGKGRPLADYAPAPDIVITPGAPDDGRGEGELLADAGSLTNLDRHNYWDKVKTDAHGRVTFPALIPGATYRIIDGTNIDAAGRQVRKEFIAAAGEAIELGDIVIEKPRS